MEESEVVTVFWGARVAQVSSSVVRSSGIAGYTLEDLEDQLRKDVLAEANANNGRILLRWHTAAGTHSQLNIKTCHASSHQKTN